jgi:hypothetical protein
LQQTAPDFSCKHTGDIKVALLVRLALVLAQSNRYISAKASLRSLTGLGQYDAKFKGLERSSWVSL